MTEPTQADEQPAQDGKPAPTPLPQRVRTNAEPAQTRPDDDALRQAAAELRNLARACSGERQYATAAQHLRAAHASMARMGVPDVTLWTEISADLVVAYAHSGSSVSASAALSRAREELGRFRGVAAAVHAQAVALLLNAETEMQRILNERGAELPPQIATDPAALTRAHWPRRYDATQATGDGDKQED